MARRALSVVALVAGICHVASTEWPSPYYAMRCQGAQALQTASMTCADYDQIAGSIQALYNKLPTDCNATYCPPADWAGCVLRVAGHDFMDYKDGQGGSDGCIDLSDPDNNGLSKCLIEGEFGLSMADAYSQFCGVVSLADFVVIAGEAVMVATRQQGLTDSNSTTPLTFKSQFKYGRSTATECSFADGRLPNPEGSCKAVESAFVTNMGLSWGESAALMGVHTLGRAQINNSGYNGFWSNSESSRRFDNNYFISLLAKGWAPEKAIAGNTAKNQWKRIDVGANEAKLGKEMMLNTDLCLAYTADSEGTVQIDASSTNCCAWTNVRNTLTGIQTYNGNDFCGQTATTSLSANTQRGLCCGSQFNSRSVATDCGTFNSPAGPAIADIKQFANDEATWLEKFKLAWSKATTNGAADLKTMDCNVITTTTKQPKQPRNVRR